MRRLVVIGGGIGGLAAAWAAKATAADAGSELDVTLLERAAEVGGKARTMVRDGWLIERGPTGFLCGTPAVDQLVDAAGLGDEQIAADDAAARRFIHVGGRMRQVSANPVGLVKSGLLSVPGMLRMLAEVFSAGRADREDESVWSFAARHFGRQAADRLAAPMVLGVASGDARKLSLAASFPKLAILEQQHGSLIRGMIARRGASKPGTLMSFRGGMQALPRALASRCGFKVRCGASVTTLRRQGTGWGVVVAGDETAIPADEVVLATEPGMMAWLLREHSEVVARELDGIPSPAIGVVALGFDAAVRRQAPTGFGVLVARGESFRMLGSVWESMVFAGRSPGGGLLIRALYGGGADPEIGRLSAAELSALAKLEVMQLHGIESPPIYSDAVQWPVGIAQYEVGHLARVARIESGLAALPGIHLAGSALYGVSFPAAAADGVRIGNRVARQLLSTSSTQIRPDRGC